MLFRSILQQAVVELRNETPPDLPQGEGTRRTSNAQKRLGVIDGKSGEEFVTDTTLESDLELYFPDQYVPSDSERMLLYRELDGLTTDEQLAAYRTRLIDRFGPVPQCGEELMRVVPLREDYPEAAAHDALFRLAERQPVLPERGLRPHP